MSAIPPQRVSQPQPLAAHFTIQSAPLLLSLIILAGLTRLYIGLFHRELHASPASFEWTSLVNNVAAARLRRGRPDDRRPHPRHRPLGRRVIDLSNSVAATHMHDGAGSMLAWTLDRAR